MLLAWILIMAIAAGGFALTYLFEDDEPFLWRFAAGIVLGSGFFGTLLFVLSLAAGLNAAVAAGALAVTMAPIGLIAVGPRRAKFEADWARAKASLQGANGARVLRFCYYAAFLLLFVLFFSQAMYQTGEGIFTGGSNNLGDLPFHLGAILSFTDGANFPPQNPSYADAKFAYPFISDLITSGFMKLGAPLREAMVWQDAAWAFSLLVVLERFALKLTGDRLAGKLAPALLFFSGGLGFIWFLGDFGEQGKGLVEFLGELPKDYTIGDQFRWGNAMITLFMTQRSLLMGMPVTIVVLGALWKVFNAEGATKDRSSLLAPFVVGLIAGTLPLVHLHSLVVLFVVTGVLFFLRLDRWMTWVTFGLGVCVIAVPELIWSLVGSASETTKFIGWHFGWDARDSNVLWFWVKNTGLFLPVLALGIYLFCFTQSHGDAKEDKEDKEEVRERAPVTLLLFYIPFAALFVICNVAKLAPWEWDNIKVLIYWWIGSIPFVAYALAWMWRRGAGFKITAAACFALLIFSGALDVWRTVTGTVKMRVFEPDAIRLAEKVKATAPAHALFLNAPTYNSAVVLTGRQSLMRYSGHLSSYGIDYLGREGDVKKIYAGGPAAEQLIDQYGVEYVLISPEEKSTQAPNQAYFNKYPVAAESGQYKIYKVR